MMRESQPVSRRDGSRRTSGDVRRARGWPGCTHLQCGIVCLCGSAHTERCATSAHEKHCGQQDCGDSDQSDCGVQESDRPA